MTCLLDEVKTITDVELSQRQYYGGKVLVVKVSMTRGVNPSQLATNKMAVLGTILYIEWDDTEFTGSQGSIGSCFTAYCHFFSKLKLKKKGKGEKKNTGGKTP
jgi:hypothetical protein